MAYPGDTTAPLLPASLAGWLQGWLCKAGGLAVLAGCMTGSVSLLTWSVSDPSLMHATSGSTQNVLGPVGAILSDVLMQMLGLAGVLFLLPPLFWALQMITQGRLDKPRPKLMMAPVAIVLLAGAVSALPVAASWPLSYGFGGLLGDRSLGVLTNVLKFFNPSTAATAAGLFLFAAGLMLLIASLGLTQQDIRMIFDVSPRKGLRRIGKALLGMRDVMQARGKPMLQAPTPTSVAAATEPEGRVEPSFADMPLRRDPPPFEMPIPVQPVPPPLVHAAPHIVPELHVSPPPPLQPPMPALQQQPFGTDRLDDPSFDALTDLNSKKIAKRFARGGMDMEQQHPPVELLDEELPIDDMPPPPQFTPMPEAGPAPAPVPLEPPPPVYRRPPVELLRPPQSGKPGPDLTPHALQARARMLEEVCSDFGVKGAVKEVRPGPVVTLFEFEPARGVKSSRVINLAEDISRAMSAHSARVAVVPGRNAIGIELPNSRRETVYLRELIEAEAFRTSDATLPLVLGKTIAGTPVFSDLARMPHLLVAGTTGSGKSVGVNAMILSLLYRLSPEQCRMIMIDPKMLELSVYNGIPHLLCPVVTDPQQAVAALNWVVREMEERYRRMSKLSVRSIDAFNGRLKQAQRHAPHDADLVHMPYIVVVVDEFADLMMVAGKEIETAVQRIAQMARAAGIHLIMATQRPSVDIITGTIKANFPTRISFKVASKFDSRTILNEQGAEQLLGQGDMLFWGGNGRSMRVHGPFVSDEEVEHIARYLGEQGSPGYVEGITDVPSEDVDAGPGPGGGDDGLDLYARARTLVLEEGRVSISYVQRRLGIGYNRAADLIERMEQDGVISQPGAQGRRQVLHERML